MNGGHVIPAEPRHLGAVVEAGTIEHEDRVLFTKASEHPGDSEPWWNDEYGWWGWSGFTNPEIHHEGYVK